MCWPERLRVAFVVLLILLFPGCLIVPVGMFTEDPYTKEKLAAISGPDADRNLVRQKFGDPLFTKENQRYWFYMDQRTTVGIIGGGSSAVLTDDTWLLVEFDPKGKVVFAEATDFEKCTSNGICLDGLDKSKNQRIDDEMLNSLKEDECAIYLYLQKLPWPLATGVATYFIDGKKIGSVNADTYLFLTHPAGDIKISAYDLTISTQCLGGQKLYVRAIKKADFSWKTGKDLAPVMANEGEKEIQVRHPSLHD